MTNQNVAAVGAETFVHGTVLSVMFNTNVEKRSGGTYPGTTLFFQNTRGQAESQSWAQQIIDDSRNIEIRNALIALQATPGAQFTLHKVKNDKGYWNVTKIDSGFVEGVRTAQTAAAAPVGTVAPSGGGGLMRSKEQCMRGEAIQAAASMAKAGGNGQVSVEAVISTAEILLNYIENGLAAPVAAPVVEPVTTAAPVIAPAPVVAAPVVAPAPTTAAAPAPAPAPTVAPAPLPTIAPSVVTAAPAAAPAPAPAPAPVIAPAVTVSAASVAAQPAVVPDGFS